MECRVFKFERDLNSKLKCDRSGDFLIKLFTQRSDNQSFKHIARYFQTPSDDDQMQFFVLFQNCHR